MSAERPITPESKEYTREDLENLFFWSFYPSQGSKALHTLTFIVLLTENPGLVSEVEKLHQELGNYSPAWLDTPFAARLVDRVGRRRTSPIHSTNLSRPPLEAEKEVRDRLQTLFEAAEAAKLYRQHPEAAPLEAFARETLSREIVLYKQAESGEKEGLMEARTRVGFSMACFYGLSPNRETHLAGSRQTPPQPGEYQDMWRKVGDFLKTSYPTLGSETKDRLDRLVELYQSATGETLTLPQ